MRVVVLNWHNYLGRGDAYVSRTRRMVAQHLTVRHEFVEVTERDLPAGREGWFNKLYLLEMFDGDVLYLDLDVTITGNIDGLVRYLERDLSLIWARNDFSYPVRPGSSALRPGFAGPLMQDGREATINSSVMLWSGRKDLSGAEALIPVCHGDQGIITSLFWQRGIGLLPDHLVQSYKYHVLQGIDVAPITVFHGQPKPHEVEGWC